MTPTPLDFALFCSIGLIGGISQYWTTLALYHAPAAAVSPFNYTALIWSSVIGFFVWSDLPTLPTIDRRRDRDADRLVPAAARSPPPPPGYGAAE